MIARTLTMGILLAASAAVAAPETWTLPTDAPARREIELRAVWRLDGADEELLLGLISDAAIGPGGAVHLVDRQLSRVLVVSPEGTHRATLGRHGEGPGDLANPHALFVLPDGRVGVVQGFPGRIVMLMPDGTPDGTVTLTGDPVEGGFRFIRDLRLAGDRLVGITGTVSFDMEQGRKVTHESFGILELDGTVVATLQSHARTTDLRNIVFDEAATHTPFDVWDVGPDGTIYTAPVRDEYRIVARDPSGVPVREMTRRCTLRKRTPEDRAALVAELAESPNAAAEIENKALDHDPAITALHVAGDGRLHVRSGRQQRHLLPVGVADRCDVIGPDGTLIEELTLRYADFDRENDLLIFLDGVHYLLVENFDPAMRGMFAPPAPAGATSEPAAAAEPLSVVYLRIP